MVSALLLAVGLAVRAAHFGYVSDDYTRFIATWVEFFANNKGFAALSASIGDYNPPYLYILAAISCLNVNSMYLVKGVSVLFDVVLAFGCCKLSSLLTDNKLRGLAAFFFVFFLPTVFLNSSCWAQCDSIYISFIVLGLYFALGNRPNAAIAVIALAFSFKLQTVFIFPMCIPLLMCKKLRLRNFLVLLPVFFAAMLPALIAGRPLADILSIYVGQTGEYSQYLTLNAPNVYWLLPDGFDHDTAFYGGIVTAAAVCALVELCAVMNRKRLDNHALTVLAMLFALALPLLLPSMHERYFYLADALAVVLACAALEYLPVQVLIQTASYSGYYAYLRLQYLYPMGFGGVIFIAAFIILFALLILRLKSFQKPKNLVDKL